MTAPHIDPTRVPLPLNGDEADLAACALQMLVQAYTEIENHEAAVAAFCLRGRLLAHAKANRRIGARFNFKKAKGYTRKPR